MSDPAHVAIIMDGNGRWAKARGLPRLAGHRAGVEALRKCVRAAGELGIDWLTVYAFSSENWSRPKSEVSDLMGLLKLFIRRDLAELHQNGVRVRVIGDRDGLQPDIKALLDEAEALTALNRALNLVIAFNYGGRDEIARAARKMARGGGSRAELAADEVTPGDLCRLSRHGRHSRSGPGHPHQRRDSRCRISCRGRPPIASSSSCRASGPISAATDLVEAIRVYARARAPLRRRAGARRRLVMAPDPAGTALELPAPTD